MLISRTSKLTAFTVAAVLAWGGLGMTQTKPKDQALDDLLKKVEEPAKKESGSPSASKGVAKPGVVAPKDKDLDSLLDKLGQTKDEAAPDGQKQPPPPGGAGANDKSKDMSKGGGDDSDKKPDKAPKGGEKSKKQELSGKEKQLDEVLDEIAGKKKKPKPGQGQKKPGDKGQGGEDGPLGDLVKQMREVEERLGKPDTGEQTRKKQTEIVKKMDGMIEQMQKMRGQKQAMRQMRQGNKPGQKPGEDQQGALANGPPPSRPDKPKPKSVLALDKNPWGHLPPDLRSEMDNIFKEDLLPAKQDLIKRYYLSVSKKSLAREE